MFEFPRPDRLYKAYIFDCDGTLAHSMPLHLDAWNHGLKTAGAPFQLKGENFLEVAGMSMQQTIEHWNEQHQLSMRPELVIDSKMNYFHNNLDEITGLDPVIDFARECLAAGASLSVASGGSRPDVIDTLKRVGVLELFPVVVTADDVERAKPHPDLFLKAAEEMGVDPADCLVIEDSPLGVEGAKRAGMDAILIPSLI